MQTTHLVGVRTSQQNLLTLCQRQNIALVLQQHLALLSSLQRSGCKLSTTKLLKALSTCVWLLEEAQTILGTQDTANSIINTTHLHLTLLYQLLQQDTELNAIGIHRHIDTSIDSNADGIFLILSYMLTREQIVDISPVGNQESIPLQVFLQPLGQILVAGMNRHAVD